MRHLWKLLPALALLVVLTVPRAEAFSDVPNTSPLYQEVQKAAKYGLMNGYQDNTFGYSRKMTRAQFTAVLVRMMGWEEAAPETPSYADVPPSHYWYAAIETARRHGVRDEIPDGDTVLFRPDWPVTRYAMCKLLVQAVELDRAAETLNGVQGGAGPEDLPFTDLHTGNVETGYVAAAYAIGLTNGTSATTFTPLGTATRGQAAAMLVRMYEKLHPASERVSGFYDYASVPQMNLTAGMDVVSAEWSRLRWDGGAVRLALHADDGSDRCLPDRWAAEVGRMNANGAEVYLDVYMDGADGLADLLAAPAAWKRVGSQIAAALTDSDNILGREPFGGVTVDFRGIPAAQNDAFTAFLRELRAALPGGKGLFVRILPGEHGASCQGDVAAVSALDAPEVVPGVSGEDALYNPPAPAAYVFRFLRNAAAVTRDRSKLALGLCLRSVAWEIDERGNPVSATPVYPSQAALTRGLARKDAETGWDDAAQSPWARYTAEDGRRYFVWYENSESIRLKRQAGRLLGLGGVAVWRLGSIPDGMFD